MTNTCSELPSAELVRDLERENKQRKKEIQRLEQKLNELENKFNNSHNKDDEKEDSGNLFDKISDIIDQLLPTIIDQVANQVAKRVDRVLDLYDKTLDEIAKIRKTINEFNRNFKRFVRQLEDVTDAVLALDKIIKNIKAIIEALRSRVDNLSASIFLNLQGNTIKARLVFNRKNSYSSVSLFPLINDTVTRTKREIEPLIESNRLRSVNLSLSTVPARSSTLLQARLFITDAKTTVSTTAATTILLPSAPSNPPPTPIPPPQPEPPEEIIIQPSLKINSLGNNQYAFIVSVNGKSDSAVLTLDALDQDTVEDLIERQLDELKHSIKVEQQQDKRFRITSTIHKTTSSDLFIVPQPRLNPSLTINPTATNEYSARLSVGGEQTNTTFKVQLTHDLTARQLEANGWEIISTLNGQQKKAVLNIKSLDDIQYVEDVLYEKELNRLTLIYGDDSNQLIELEFEEVDIEELKEFIQERTSLLPNIFSMLGGKDWFGSDKPDEDAKPNLSANIEDLMISEIAKLYDNPEELNRSRESESSSYLELFFKLQTPAFARSGFKEYPLNVPEDVSDKNSPKIDLPHSLAFQNWRFKQFDSLFGQYPIEIEIEDNDLIQTGNQKLKLEFPNQAEAMAELLGLAVMNSAKVDALMAIDLRTLGETGSDLQVNTKAYNLLLAIAAYLGFKSKQKTETLKLLHNPTISAAKSNNESLSKALEPTEVKVRVEEFDDDVTLESNLTPLQEAAAIIKAVYYRRMPNAGALKTLVKNALALINEIDVEGDEDFDSFTEKLERGFIDQIVDDETNLPYGRSFERRPRVQDFGDDDSTDG